LKIRIDLKRFKMIFVLVFCFRLWIADSLFADYRQSQTGEPSVRAILYGAKEKRAWIYHQGQRFHVVPGMHIDSEWTVEEIRRESVLFRKTSTRDFVEMKVLSSKPARFHRFWSFVGQPLALWETLEILTLGFGFNAVMHYQAGGPVVPAHHADSLEGMLLKALPSHHRFAFVGPILLVLPVHPAAENWTNVIARLKQFDPQTLTIRYPGLSKPGTLLARGSDVQFVMKQIALGGKVPIQFPRDLHFPVYATFRDIPFCQILVKTLYLNQCFIIEREEGLEVQPWPRQVQPILIAPIPQMISVGPFEPQPGWGPTVPPEMQPPDESDWKKFSPQPPSFPIITPSSGGKYSE